jgi:hypothetical protein
MVPSALRCGTASRPACVAAARASRLGAWATRPGGACARGAGATSAAPDAWLAAARTALGRVQVRLASGRGVAPMTVMGKGPKKGKSKDEEASVYKDTVNLPQTSFGACHAPRRLHLLQALRCGAAALGAACRGRGCVASRAWRVFGCGSGRLWACGARGAWRCR